MKVVEIGLKELTLKFESLPENINKSLANGMNNVVIMLQHRVSEKLLGEVLNRRTGKLYNSIGTEVTNTSDLVSGRVFSSGVPYAAIHEYGGAVKTRLGRGEKPSRRGGFSIAVMPERSYMRSTLKEKTDDIIGILSNAVEEAVK